MPLKDAQGRTFFTIFFGIILVIGLLSVPVVLNVMARAGDAATWPSTTGTVDESRVVRDFDAYYPLVGYAYAVNGQEYHSYGIWLFAKESTDINWAKEIITAYPRGSTVHVYYNPSMPTDTFLQKGDVPVFQVAPIVVAAILIGTGAGGLVYIRRKTKAVKIKVTTGPPNLYGKTYDIIEEEPESRVISPEEAVLWEGRPEKGAMLVIFPDGSILGYILFALGCTAFLIYGLTQNLFPVTMIALILIASITGLTAMRVRTGARRYSALSYVLTERHLSIEGGKWQFTYMRRSGPYITDLAMDLLNARRRYLAAPNERVIDLRRLKDPVVRRSFGQRLLGVGSIYVSDEKLPLLECIRDPEMVLNQIKGATWKMRKKAASAPAAPEQPW